MLDEIVLTAAARATLLEAARAAAPHECAALLGGARDGARVTVRRVVNLPNLAETDDAFEVAPEAFFAAERQLAATGASFVGFAHSHPRGSCAPSARDRAELWTDCAQLITDGDEVHGWRLDEQRVPHPIRLRTTKEAR